MNETLTVQVNADTQQFNTGIGGVVQRLGGAGPLAIAGAAAAAAAAIGKFTADSVKLVAEVEDSMRQFQVETGASAAEAEAFGESLRELYRSNTDTLAQLTEAAETVTQRWGSLGDQTDEVTQGFLDFAKVTGQDTSQAISDVTDVMLAFGEPLENAGGLMDALAAASQETGAPLETLQGALGEAAPLFEALNMGMEESIAFLAGMEANGVTAETAVRGLRNIIERAVALTQYENLVVDDLPEKIRDYSSSQVLIGGHDPTDLVPLEDVERRYITHVLQAVGGNKTLASRVLGLDRKTLYRKLQQYGAED